MSISPRLIRNALAVAGGIAAFLVAWLSGLDIFERALNTVVTLSAAFLFLHANILPIGHGINGKRHVAGMPVSLLGLYVLILISALWSLLQGSLFPESRMLSYALAFSIFASIFVGMIDWYFFSQKSTYHETEDYVRRGHEREGGWKESATRLDIQRRRQAGRFGPVPEAKEK